MAKLLKMLKYNFSDFQTLNSIYPKNNNNKKINEIILMDENVDLNSIPIPVIDTSQNKQAIYNNLVYSNMNKKVDSKIDFIGKLSLNYKLNYHSPKFVNYPDSGINYVNNNYYTIYKTKISDELVDNRNIFFTHRVNIIRKEYNIPHPNKKN